MAQIGNVHVQEVVGEAKSMLIMVKSMKKLLHGPPHHTPASERQMKMKRWIACVKTTISFFKLKHGRLPLGDRRRGSTFHKKASEVYKWIESGKFRADTEDRRLTLALLT